MPTALYSSICWMYLCNTISIAQLLLTAETGHSVICVDARHLIQCCSSPTPIQGSSVLCEYLTRHAAFFQPMTPPHQARTSRNLASRAQICVPECAQSSSRSLRVPWELAASRVCPLWLQHTLLTNWCGSAARSSSPSCFMQA